MKYFLPPFDKKSIEAQYKQLAKRFHPDVKGGSEKAFKELTEEKNLVLAWAAMPVDKLPREKRTKLPVVKSRPLKKILRPRKREVHYVLNLNGLAEFIKQIKKL